MTQREIHINDSLALGEPQASERTFTQLELMAFYHASLPGMHPEPALNETIRAFQAAEQEYISHGKSPAFTLAWARAQVMFLGLVSTLAREGVVEQRELHRAFGKLWKNGL